MANDRPLLLDVTRLIWRRWVGRLPTGIDRVCLAYLEQYREKAQAVVQWRGFRRIMTESASDQLFGLLMHPTLNVRRKLALFLGRECLRRAPRQLGLQRFYLNVGHTGLQKQGYVEWTRSAGVRPIYMIHDLIPITHPEYCRAGEAERHALRVRTMLATAAGIIGNSQATLDGLSAFANDVSMAPPAMISAPLGTDKERIDAHRAATPEQATYVMLGTIEARKNHILMLQIWARLARELGSKAPRLLIIGQRGWECEQVFDLLDQSPILRGSVFEIGTCSDADLDGYLRSARALLFPTLIEGFGLPLIEALAVGTPVIASNLPVFHEVGQEVPDFIDPLDVNAWHAAILRYAKPDSSDREAQLSRMKRYFVPRWNDHFSRVDTWLETL